MSLLLLTQTPAISIYHDSANNWLYIDWQGHVTLPIVQESCTLIARCFLQGQYTKVLNDNTNVLSLSAEVSPWLAQEFLPYLLIGGIQCMAWVYAPSISTQCYTDIALLNLEAPVVALFSDLATAYGWLKTARFVTSAEIPELDQLVGSLQDRSGPAWLLEALQQHVQASLAAFVPPLSA